MALPANVSFGTITGRFLTATADAPADQDRDPEGIAATDLQIRFTPDLSPAVVRDASASPPTIFALADVVATVGPTGDLLGPDGAAGVRLVASTGASLEPSGWTWRVVLSSNTFPAMSFSFALDGGATVDLASVVQVPASAGTTLAAWLQAVTDAQAARDAAAASAAAAAASAASGGGGSNATVAGYVGTAGATKTALDAAYVPQRGLWSQVTASPLYSAHRNAANVYPENSLEGVRACIESGVDAINVDTWPLLDGGLAVLHDLTLDRTTTSTGNVTDLDSAGVQQVVVDTSTWFAGAWPNLQVPLFVQIAALAGNRVPLEIEAKPTTGSGAALVAALARYALTPQTVRISSFSLTELVTPVAAGFTCIYVIAGNPTTVATSTVTSAGISWIAMDMTNAALSTKAAKIAEVARWHAAGVKVQIYTALRKVGLWDWLAAGVDEVAADEPIYLRQTWKALTRDPFGSKVPYHGLIGQSGLGDSYGRAFVGPVNQGRLAKVNVQGNFTLIGSMSPIAGAIETTLQVGVSAGATSIIVGPQNQPKAGKALTIDPAGTAETRTPAADGVLNTDGTWTVAVPALSSAHAAGARVYGGTWTLTVPVTFDVMGSDASRWAGVVVACPDDNPYGDAGAVTDQGYIVVARANGQVQITAKVAGASVAGQPAAVTGTAASAPLVLSAGLTAGAAITALPVNATPATIPAGALFVLPTGQVVTTSASAAAGATSVPINSMTPNAAVASGASLPNQMTLVIQRTATAMTATWGGASYSYTTSQWFGGFFHLGMNAQTAGMQLSYGGANKVTVT